MKKSLMMVLKLVVAAAILIYLFHDAQRDRAFTTLIEQKKDWWLLACALAACGSAVLLTFIRWYYLVRALDLPFTPREALRIGFFGYLFNLAPLGIVGGDLLKAVMLARHHPGRRAESLATVFVDRVIGLFMLFVVASAAILLSGFWRIDGAMVRRICQATLILTAVGAAGIFAALAPDLSRGGSKRLLAKTPYVGSILEKLLTAIEMYRRRRGVVLAAALLSVGVHSLFSLGIFLIAHALYENVPSLGLHFVLSPLSAAAGVIPLPLGPFEAVLNYLYTQVPAVGGAAIASGQGLVIALTYRIITLLVAAAGTCFYLGSRAELTEALEEARHEAELPPPDQAVDALA